MQRHVDIYRHKVIMGIHSRNKKPLTQIGGFEVDQEGGGTIQQQTQEEEAKGLAVGTNFDEDLEINANEIPIDDPN